MAPGQEANGDNLEKSFRSSTQKNEIRDSLSLSLDRGFRSNIAAANGKNISSHTMSERETLYDGFRQNSWTFRAPEMDGYSPPTHDNDDQTDSEQSKQSSNKHFSFNSLTKDQKVILTCYSFTNLLCFLSISILAPFFPKEANSKGVSHTISGWIFGVFSLVQFVSSPVFGKLLPYVGSRFMYIGGLFVCGGCTVIFGCLTFIDTKDGIWLFVSCCFAVRILLGLGFTAVLTAAFVMLVKVFPNDIATVIGIGEIFTGIGMVTGPAIGGFLYAAGGFVFPFAVIGGACFLALPLILYLVPKQDDSISQSSLPLRGLLCHPKSIVNSLGIIVAAAVWAVLDPTLEPHLRVYNLSSELIGILFLVMAASYTLASPFWGWVADKFGDIRILLASGFILSATGLLLLGPSPVIGFDLSFNEMWLTVTSLVLLGVASALCVVPSYQLYLDALEELGYPEDTRTYGMISGLWVAVYSFGEFIGPSLGGFLFEKIGFEWMATEVAGACVFTWIIKQDYKKKIFCQ